MQLNNLKLAVITLLSIMLIALTACIEEETITQQAENTAAPNAGDSTPVAGGQTVDLEIFEGPGGSVVVFVPVYINGEGPFDFVLDTGASRSVLDQSVTDQLELPQRESPGKVTGIEGATEVKFVDVENWSIGDTVDLPSTQLTTFSIFSDQGADMLEAQVGREVQGLLGSDVLASFGLITINFDDGRLDVGR